MTARFTAVVLAAGRGGVDPVAAAAGRSHKCLVDIHGRTMLARVLEALAASASVGAVAISIDNPAVLRESAEIAALIERHEITLIDAAATPSRSVGQAVDALARPWPVLVATADSPLLSPAMVDHFCGHALISDADIAVGLASATVVLERYPDASRSFLRFRDGRYTGCNLFALMTPAALDAVAFWVRVERDRKHPWRLFKGFGPLAMLRFLMGGATLGAALAAAGRRLGMTAAAVIMPFAEAAIDVDSPNHLDLVKSILRARDEGSSLD